jgi:hypothetical protein
MGDYYLLLASFEINTFLYLLIIYRQHKKIRISLLHELKLFQLSLQSKRKRRDFI